MDSKESLIKMQDVGISIAKRTILQDINLTLSAGEIITIIGPNGAGKSTLVKLLLKLLPPSNGVVEHQPGLKIGYVPQRFHLDSLMPMTVERLLSFTRKASSQFVDKLSIKPLLKHQVSELSGGELQRVLLARALNSQPHLLVLDEPTQGVDFSGQSDFYQLITDISQSEQCAVLLISHDLHVVMAGTHRVICLNRHICCSGKPDAVSNHPAYLSLFGPSTSQKLAIYPHRHDHAHDLDGGIKPEGDESC